MNEWMNGGIILFKLSKLHQLLINLPTTTTTFAVELQTALKHYICFLVTEMSYNDDHDDDDDDAHDDAHDDDD